MGVTSEVTSEEFTPGATLRNYFWQALETIWDVSCQKHIVPAVLSLWHLYFLTFYQLKVQAKDCNFDYKNQNIEKELDNEY